MNTDTCTYSRTYIHTHAHTNRVKGSPPQAHRNGIAAPWLCQCTTYPLQAQVYSVVYLALSLLKPGVTCSVCSNDSLFILACFKRPGTDKASRHGQSVPARTKRHGPDKASRHGQSVTALTRPSLHVSTVKNPCTLHDALPKSGPRLGSKIVYVIFSRKYAILYLNILGFIVGRPSFGQQDNI
jgi:hypothetical protein